MGALVDTAAAARAGNAKPVALVEQALARIEAAAALNAFVALDKHRSLAEARNIAARMKEGEYLPLAGVPLGVKDNLFVEGWPIRQGSHLFSDHIAPFDCVAVERARAAGAVIIGITACPEFACKGSTSSPLYGPTQHPADPRLSPGGSSGGSACAIAANLVPAALGTDAGGSGRRPAAHVGCVGFKGTVGAIPYGPGFLESVADISVIAPMASDVADTVALFEAIAGPDARDPASSVTLAPAPPTLPQRIAFSPRFGLDVPIDPDVEIAVAAAVEALKSADFPIISADPLWLDGAGEDALMPLQHAGLAHLFGGMLEAGESRFDPEIAAQVRSGLALSGQEVAAALQASLDVRLCVAGFLAEHDLLIGPTTPCVAWAHEDGHAPEIGGVAAGPRGHAVFTPLFNHARVPAVSIPCGRGRDGLPVGLQIVGRLGEDRAVLAAAAAAEEVLASADLWNGLR